MLLPVAFHKLGLQLLPIAIEECDMRSISSRIIDIGKRPRYLRVGQKTAHLPVLQILAMPDTRNKSSHVIYQ